MPFFVRPYTRNNDHHLPVIIAVRFGLFIVNGPRAARDNAAKSGPDSRQGVRIDQDAEDIHLFEYSVRSAAGGEFAFCATGHRPATLMGRN